MRRKLLMAGVVLTLALAAAGILVNLRAAGASALPAPDPAKLITLTDGSELPLAEVLRRIEHREPLVPPALLDARLPDSLREPGAAADGGEDPPSQLAGLGIPEAVWHAQFGTVFALAEEHLHRGNLDQAEALFLSIAEGEPGYAYAQRRLAWDVLTLGRGEPQRAVSYAHEALMVDPFNGNSWQDAVRVYAHTLGVPLR